MLKSRLANGNLSLQKLRLWCKKARWIYFSAILGSTSIPLFLFSKFLQYYSSVQYSLVLEVCLYGKPATCSFRQNSYPNIRKSGRMGS